MAEHAGRGDRAYGERDEADDDPASAPGGRVQHCDEHREEHQRRAQIALHDEHAHRDQPHHDDRTEVLDAGQLESQHLLASHSELVAVVEQVGGEEEREEQLGEFGGLQRISADADPDLGAVDVAPQTGDHGRQQQYQAYHHVHVRVFAQHTIVAHDRHEDATQRQGYAQPDQLP